MDNCKIAANADASGIGIRVNLYTTVLLMALIPDIQGRTSPLLEVLTENAGISGLALLITAVHETTRKNLSLYHAIFIIHILYFTGVMVAPTGHYKRDTFKRRAIVAGLITYACYLLFTAFAIYVWTKDVKFGSPDVLTTSCTNFEVLNQQITYRILFLPVYVQETWLKTVWIVGLGVSLALLVLFPVFGCIYFFNGGVITQGRPARSHNPLFFWVIWVGKLLVAVYGVTTLELYVKDNSGIIDKGENAWTFGQVFAFVQLVTTLNEAIHCFISVYSEPAGSIDHEERESVISTDTHNSSIVDVVRLGPLAEKDGHAPDEAETDLNITSTTNPAVQQVLRSKNPGAMMFV